MKPVTEAPPKMQVTLSHIVKLADEVMVIKDPPISVAERVLVA